MTEQLRCPHCRKPVAAKQSEFSKEAVDALERWLRRLFLTYLLALTILWAYGPHTW